MAEVVPPDWAALYQKHRHTMYRVAYRLLRGTGREVEAEDVVSTAIVSLMQTPPSGVKNWEAVLVTAVKRRSVDLLRSAAHRRAGPELKPEHDAPDQTDMADEVAELVDRQHRGAVLWDKLTLLDGRHRKVVWDLVALGRARDEVAEELGVTPGRVSQMRNAALRVLRDALIEEGVES